MTTQSKTSFQPQDFYDEPPRPRYYPGTISSAHFQQGTNGNYMLQVVHTLADVRPAFQLVVDCFVLEGKRVSPVGILLARRRLVQLYHACRLYPCEGEQIIPDELLFAELQVRVLHDEWQGRDRLRVAGYRPLLFFNLDQKAPSGSKQSLDALPDKRTPNLDF